ncbi:hypothetical protein AMECASPLE_024399 [Ameca splendens]|uniref:Uncharacterized protein n=1 Tax=Ameca splendens TaxID=208324 RepID=A0ABV0XHE3_9TELE
MHSCIPALLAICESTIIQTCDLNEPISSLYHLLGDYREVWKGMLQEPNAEKQQDFVFSFETEFARFYTDGKLQKRALNLGERVASSNNWDPSFLVWRKSLDPFALFGLVGGFCSQFSFSFSLGFGQFQTYMFLLLDSPNL